MPPHPSYNFEKSPVDAWDYEGLQLDTRARENQDKHLDGTKPQGFLDDDFDDRGNYLNEKQAHVGVVPESAPTSPDSAFGSGVSPVTPWAGLPSKGIDEIVGTPPPVPEGRRTCGLKRKHFWELFGLILGIVITAAIVGGVVGGLQARNGSPAADPHPAAANATNSNTNSTTFTPLQSSDVMVGSPLNVVSYDEGPGQSVVARQAFRLTYQSAIGNIKEAVSYGMASWLSAVPIFTDAINNTGLATVTYLNDTSQQGSIFYVGDNGLLQEKRKIYNNSLYWEPGTLNDLNIAAVGNLSLPSQGDDPKNGWDGYRIAAVYSVNFHEGPGIRLFYHAEQLNGSTFVQEVIWNQKNDSWSKGAQLQRPYPNSQFAATIDESTNILRVFYSSGNKTLSESWLDISNPNGAYASGLDFENLLYGNAADIAAVSLNGTTYVYHYSASDQTAQAGIHELSITGIPDSVNNQETYNLSSPFVVTPLLTTNNDTSLYQPLAASNTVVPGLTEEVYVFWADKPSGDPTASVSGFNGLSEISRPVANATWPSTGQLVIPLGDDNTQPS